MRKLMERYPVGAVLLLVFLCLAPVMALRDVTPSNELRYLSIADEALKEAHVFAFTNQGEPYADKPPLYFWLLMLCRRIFGRHCIFALSLLSFIPATVVTCVMDRWVYGTELRTARERMATALLLCSTFYWLALSVFLRMDMLMTMFIVLALYAWHRDKPWLFAIYSFLALFTKGPVGILMPVLVILTYVLSGGGKHSDRPRAQLGRFLSWRFLLLAGGCCAVWFTGAWLDGGTDYLRNLLYHQTVDRTVNAFHHKEPFWFYLLRIGPLLLPWCLLTLPACVSSLLRRGEEKSLSTEGRRTEKLFRCAVFVPFVALSCVSGKLPVYLLPLFPFTVYLLPLYISRKGWSGWMGRMLGIAALFSMLIGLAVSLLPLLHESFPALEPYAFLDSPIISVAGACILAGGAVSALRAFRPTGTLRSAIPLSVSILVSFLFISSLLPRANDFLGCRSLCRDIPAGVPVYVAEKQRLESLEVYLEREVQVLKEGDRLPADAAFVVKVSSDAQPSPENRRCRVYGNIALWLPENGCSTNENLF